MRAKRGHKDRLSEARRSLAEVARRRPQWARVPLLEAELEELEGDPERALSNYQLAFDLGDHRDAVVQRLVELLCERQQFAKADELMLKLQKTTTLSGEVGRLAAQMAVLTQDPGRAVTLARNLVQAGPQDYRNHLWLGLSLWAAGQRDEAEASLRQAIGRAENAAAPRVALVRFLVKTGQERKAKAALREAEAKLADKTSLALAQCYEAVGRLDEAERLYQAALVARPEDCAVLRSVASFYLGSDRFPKAEQALRQLADHVTASTGDAAWARRQLALGWAKGGARPWVGPGKTCAPRP
jgi:Tfp pilus assembly protein PilF